MTFLTCDRAIKNQCIATTEGTIIMQYRHGMRWNLVWNVHYRKSLVQRKKTCCNKEIFWRRQQNPGYIDGSDLKQGYIVFLNYFVLFDDYFVYIISNHKHRKEPIRTKQNFGNRVKLCWWVTTVATNFKFE